MGAMTTTAAVDAMPQAHPTHPVPDCARCHGATCGAALATVIESRQHGALPLGAEVVHQQAAALIAEAAIAPVLCARHRDVPKPRWTPEHVDYARRAEAARPGQRVVGVVVDTHNRPVASAFTFSTCVRYARRGHRVIILSDCREEEVAADTIQRICDTRYRMIVPR